MRSIADNASSGRVSHVGDPASHSFGPREPKSVMKSSNADRKPATLRFFDFFFRRSRRPATPLLKCFVRVFEFATWRPMSHMA